MSLANHRPLTFLSIAMTSISPIGAAWRLARSLNSHRHETCILSITLALQPAYLLHCAANVCPTCVKLPHCAFAARPREQLPPRTLDNLLTL